MPRGAVQTKAEKVQLFYQYQLTVSGFFALWRRGSTRSTSAKCLVLLMLVSFIWELAGDTVVKQPTVVPVNDQAFRGCFFSLWMWLRNTVWPKEICVCIFVSQQNTEKQTRKPTEFGERLRFEEKASPDSLYLKNASLVHLVRLVQSTHYVTADEVSIISKKTPTEYFSLF